MMIPVDQTLFGDGKGNCFPACLASVLELDISIIPHFCREYTDTEAQWFEICNKWLQQFGLGMVFLIVGSSKEEQARIKEYCSGYQIAGVLSPRKLKHAVVLKDGVIVHDPNPSRDSMTAAIEDVQMFIMLDASKHPF